MLINIAIYAFCPWFSFDWVNISNSQDGVSPYFKTPWISSKIPCYASYFQLCSRCLEMGSNTVFQVEFHILLEILKSSFQVRNVEREMSNETFLKNTQRFSIKIDFLNVFTWAGGKSFTQCKLFAKRSLSCPGLKYQ